MLTSLDLNDYTALLGSDAPAPGGGSAAALAGAQGAALCAMVASLTLGREKYAAYRELAEQTFHEADSLCGAFLAALEADTAAFNGFSAAMALPKTTEEEKAARLAAMQAALAKCTESPLHIMELAEQTLLLTAGLLGRSNLSAASDLGVSALELKSAMQSAWLNVLINIPSLKDREKAEGFRARGEAMLSRSLPLADEIYETVKASLS